MIVAAIIFAQDFFFAEQLLLVGGISKGRLEFHQLQNQARTTLYPIGVGTHKSRHKPTAIQGHTEKSRYHHAALQQSHNRTPPPPPLVQRPHRMKRGRRGHGQPSVSPFTCSGCPLWCRKCNSMCGKQNSMASKIGQTKHVHQLSSTRNKELWSMVSLICYPCHWVT